MAAPYVLVQGRRFLRERIFRDMTNPFDYMDDGDLIKRYRLTRELIAMVCEMVNDDVKRPTARSNSLPVSIQVLATGTFQYTNGDLHGISQSCVSRCVGLVSLAICQLAKQFITFPPNNNVNQVIGKFSALANVPNVIGAIDCTHIAIKAPSTDEHLYVNRKGFHSINVQVVCDSEMKIIDIVAKWPGSSHDAFIWTSSAPSTKFKTGAIPVGWLVGDSGYPLRPWLLTPVLNPVSQKEERYNGAHAVTRSIIERCFGVLKMRFRCLDKSGGSLCFTPLKTCRWIRWKAAQTQIVEKD